MFEHQVATLDRKSFGRIGAEPRHYLRLSIATDLAWLREGLDRLEVAAADREGFRRLVERGEHLW